MLRYLYLVAFEGLLPFPVTLQRSAEGGDLSRFVLEWGGRRRDAEPFDLTEGSARSYRREPSGEVSSSSKEAVEQWAEILFAAFLARAEALPARSPGRVHLLICDWTGLGLLVPLGFGAQLLQERVERWYLSNPPACRFRRISVLRDRSLLLDLTGEGRLLSGESAGDRLPGLLARDEAELKQTLREVERFRRANSIRHLKAYGSILSDRIHDFRADSDLDLLVEFEPGADVTLLDMARMERELGELIGFKVDLRTAGDLSPYFRREVLEKAVELRAS